MPKYNPTVISGPQFKGLSQNLALTSGSPNYALDCVNVLPSLAGLAKLRVPTDLSTAVGGIGPDQFGMWEGTSSKAVLAFFGQSIYVISLDDFTPAIFDSNIDYVGPVPWNTVLVNNRTFLQNGKSIPLKYTGASQLFFWGIQKAGVVTIGTPAGTGITLATGRQYRVSYKSADNVVGTASTASASTGAVTNKYIPITIPAPALADAQITLARIYATLDGASDYFFHSEIDVSGGLPITINDDKPDTDLDQSERAPLINDTPPIAKFMSQWGGRIVLYNLVHENVRYVAYTGYDRIFVGRPEETCPPGNRIKMDTGADEISGGGVIPAGVIVFDRANKMFMARGQLEDITIDAPVEFSLFLQRLPYDIGCASHYTIASTVRGLVWLGPCLGVYMFDGSGPPQDISEGAEPILRSINMTAIGNSRAVYWQYRARDWYVLAIPTGSEPHLNKILIFDLNRNEQENFGIVPIDVGSFQSLGIVEMVDGTQKLVIGQSGKLKELKVTQTTKNGIEESISSTSGSLGAFWRGNPEGNEAPHAKKFFRWSRTTADNGGIRIKRYLYNDDVTQPEVIEFVALPSDGKISTNRKARRMSTEIRFADDDVAQNVLEHVSLSVPVSIT